MKFSYFFIERPIFAAVISIVIMIVGGIAYFGLPIAQYPEVAPPTVVVTTNYPGANPEVISETVATPLEQAINGVEDMLYLTSQCTTDGAMTLTITFKLGTDLDKAQVLVQNRVATAVPRLPEEVQRIGVTTDKSSPDLLLVVHLLSPENRYDQLYISNYASLHVVDVLRRLEGVGSVNVFGGREYSMRVWLDPEKLSSVNLTASDVVAALREQNVQVAAGVIGQQPVGPGHAFQLSISTLGRLVDPVQFGDIVVKTGEQGRVVKVRDIARVELGGLDYSVNSYLGFPNAKEAQPAVALAIQQRPGSNAIATAHAVRYEAVNAMLLNAMLLNEFLKEHRKIEGLEATVAQQKRDFQSALAQQAKDLQACIAQQQDEIKTLAVSLKEQAVQLRNVSYGSKVSESSPRVVTANP